MSLVVCQSDLEAMLLEEGLSMQRWLALFLSFCSVSTCSAAGLLVPDDVKLPPLAMVSHRVLVTIQDQVAITTVEQVFRNHTDRNLEATYVFPVPSGASVNKFSMWIDGKETAGELLDAKKAQAIYTDIVRRTQDPGLLEYLGNNLMRLRVFPIPPRSEQKVKFALTSLAPMEQGVVEYIYPLKTDGKATQTLQEFLMKLSLKSQHPIQSLFSPTHAVTQKRISENEVHVEFEKQQALLDKDFQLFFGLGKNDISLSPLLYRPVASEDGYFLLMMTPHVESRQPRVPRDLVLVLDTSGSMSDVKMSQAKKALKLLLDNLTPIDRFGLLAFSSTVRSFEEHLLPATEDQLQKARKWVDDLRAGGGTAIQPALDAALDLRTKEPTRSFTICFFTDGLPTLDERNPDQIVKNVLKRTASQENTRIFTFGVGDDVSATLLDQLAEATRAVSTYVRPAEDIESKASALNAKISHPVMANVKLSTTNIKLHEIYPPRLPDLFQGGQLVLLGRYSGDGPASIKLRGLVGTEERELVYELTFPKQTSDGKEFVEHLWARRKVGYLLDQIRIHGESREVVQEVLTLAKKYGIATPYTSYLVVPDGPLPVIPPPGRRPPRWGDFPPGGPIPLGAAPEIAIGPGGTGGSGAGGAKPKSAAEIARQVASQAAMAPGEKSLALQRGAIQQALLTEELKNLSADKRREQYARALEKAQVDMKANQDALANLRSGQLHQNQQGKLGVDLAEASNNLRNQSRLSLTATRMANSRRLIEVGGVWIDEQFHAKMPILPVRSQSEAYFQLLQMQPKLKEVFMLGNFLVWISPSGTALVIDPKHGHEQLSAEQMRSLFEKLANSSKP